MLYVSMYVSTMNDVFISCIIVDMGQQRIFHKICFLMAFVCRSLGYNKVFYIKVGLGGDSDVRIINQSVSRFNLNSFHSSQFKSTTK